MFTLKVIFINANQVPAEKILNSSFLSDSDFESLEKYKNEMVKKEKACSLILKNKYVGEYYIDEYGKPLSKETCFNISHSKGVVVFTKYNAPIGIDIEKIRNVESDLIDYISSKEEKEYIKDEKNFFEVWTSKESLVKAKGVGIKEKISEIPALPINGIKTYKEKKYISRNIEYKGHIISISIKGETPFDIEVREEEI